MHSPEATDACAHACIYNYFQFVRIVEKHVSLERRSVTSDRARRATQTAAKREEGLQRRRDGWPTTVPERREARLGSSERQVG